MPRKRPWLTELRHRLNAGRTAVRAQVAFFRAQLGQVECHWKEDNSRVTFADFAISEKILAALREDFPQDDFCSEESNPEDEVLALKGDFAWVLDPIDGTNNYYLGLPQCAISLALLHQGQPVYGFLYDGSRDRLVEGGPGQPLLDGGARLTAAQRPRNDNEICAVHFPLQPEQLELARPLLERYRVRAYGSSALNLTYTALGKLDGCLDFQVHSWDIAAGVALLEAVGGEIHYLAQKPFPLREFHVRQPRIQFLAGSAGFCKVARELMGLA